MAGGEHPGWKSWRSDKGHHYATGAGKSALMPGASVTVDAKTAAGLDEAIAEAEREAAKVRYFRERYGA